MKLPAERQPGTLIKRYKRFLADIQLNDGTTLTAHCPNSGSMLGCSNPGSPVILSRSDNPKRKYAWTLEMVQENGVWIGVNTSLTNSLIHEALENEVIDDFGPLVRISREVKTSARSRLDFRVETRTQHIFIEVKNCSLAKDRIALFPDAVTLRGTKHLQELVMLRQQGFGAAIVFCIQRHDVEYFQPAFAIDPTYAKNLNSALDAGVRALAYVADVSPEEISISRKIPLWKDVHL